MYNRSMLELAFLFKNGNVINQELKKSFNFRDFKDFDYNQIKQNKKGNKTLF